MFDTFLKTLTSLPTLTRFAIALAVFLFVPRLCQRIRLPSAVGLLTAGVLLGPSVLAVTPRNPPVAAFFSEIGKLLLMFFAGLAVYVPVVLFGLSTLARRFLRRRGDSKENQFFLILLIMIVAAEGAELIHLESIIGAFLAGLAVNRSIKRSEAKQELEFLGNTLFIPMFFLTIGFLIDLHVFANTILSHFGLCVAVVGGLICAKVLAALAAQELFGYSTAEGLLMGGLSLPQVAATP